MEAPPTLLKSCLKKPAVSFNDIPTVYPMDVTPGAAVATVAAGVPTKKTRGFETYTMLLVIIGVGIAFGAILVFLLFRLRRLELQVQQANKNINVQTVRDMIAQEIQNTVESLEELEAAEVAAAAAAAAAETSSFFLPTFMTFPLTSAPHHHQQQQQQPQPLVSRIEEVIEEEKEVESSSPAPPAARATDVPALCNTEVEAVETVCVVPDRVVREALEQLNLLDQLEQADSESVVSESPATAVLHIVPDVIDHRPALPSEQKVQQEVPVPLPVQQQPQEEPLPVPQQPQEEPLPVPVPEPEQSQEQEQDGPTPKRPRGRPPRQNKKRKTVDEVNLEDL